MLLSILRVHVIKSGVFLPLPYNRLLIIGQYFKLTDLFLKNGICTAEEFDAALAEQFY
jgi:hypothetical protein